MSESWVDQLRMERLLRRIPQGTLAKQLGVTQSTVSLWESGIQAPLRENALLWAAALEVTLPDGVLATLRVRVAKCGSDSGYQRHRRYGTAICEPCTRAHREYTNDYKRNRFRRSGVRRV